MKTLLIVVSTCLAVSLSGNSFGQTQPDTLALARELKSKGQLRKASALLELWCATHPPQAEALWLYAQNEYWRKKYHLTRRLYAQAIDLQPDNLYLLLDFAETLLGMGRFAEAHRVMQGLAEQNKQDSYARTLMAKYHYWTGDYRAALAISIDSTTALSREITQAAAPWVGLFSAYAGDDQPLERLDVQAEGRVYVNRFADIRLGASVPQFNSNGMWRQAYLFQIVNKTHLPKTGTILEASAGIFIQNKGQHGTGRIALTQRLPEGLSLSASLSRGPYLYTLASLDNNVIRHLWSTSLDWHERHGFWAQAGIQAEFFPDDNRVSSYWAWVLSPPLALGHLSLRAGYAYQYADSQQNRFIAKKSIDEILNPYDSMAVISGIYAPYFTPEQQQVHAALALLEWKPAKGIVFSANGKYGFSAKTLNPYLFLDVDPTNAFFINSALERTNYTPFEAGAKLVLSISAGLTAEASYAFTRNFFYENHTAAVALRYLF